MITSADRWSVRTTVLIGLARQVLRGRIEDDTADPTARQAVARAVIQLARALRLDTVAEGIENQAQADRLRDFGYTLGQGFHLARPMPAQALTALLAARRATVAVG